VVIEQYRLHRNRADVPTLLFALEWQVVELIWVKFTVRAHTPRARRWSCAHRAAEERAETRDSAQNIDRDPPRLVPREQLAWQEICLLVDPETAKR
jgi:hypothetical protein